MLPFYQPESSKSCAIVVRKVLKTMLGARNDCDSIQQVYAEAPLHAKCQISYDVCPQVSGNFRLGLGRFADVCEKRRLETMRKLREWRAMKRRKRRRREEVKYRIDEIEHAA